ncbi:MAG: FliI/YscN family ATPase [Labilithrix sp.]|nr:FliI/YscN family ATPase [Labilithrix sp.]MCW5832773.1 FliI/YscN family ATPase [Labilithrix sp.]
MIDLSSYEAEVRAAPLARAEGRVEKVVGLLVEISGLDGAVGRELEIDLPGRRVTLEVIGFRDGRLLAAPLGPTSGIAPGARVRLRTSEASAEVGEALLGRVIDAFGRPLDQRPPPRGAARSPLHAEPPAPFARRPIDTPLETGVRALDALLAFGEGQRIGLFAGTGVGKSTLLGMLCRHANADVIVAALIGERGREVGDFVRHAIGPESLSRCVVVAATSDAPPLVRVRGALRATAIAEHFRKQGKRVLLVMDSVTRYAMALREASLAAGEPPLTKGYTPTVFAALPPLLERAGRDSGPGSITAVYTVLVEGDDMNDPIADTVRGILDGHVILSRKLGDRGHHPAIDVLRSVSRVARDVSTSEHVGAAGRVRELLAAYEEAADLIQIGAYVPGSDARVDAARALHPVIEALLRQPPDEVTSRGETIARLRAIAERSR